MKSKTVVVLGLASIAALGYFVRSHSQGLKAQAVISQPKAATSEPKAPQPQTVTLEVSGVKATFAP